MHWLWRAYVEKFSFWGMVVMAMLPAGIIAQVVGRYLGKLWDIDDQLLIGACFFIVLVAEGYAYDRLRWWWYFRKRRP